MCADQPDVPTASTNKYQCWKWWIQRNGCRRLRLHPGRQPRRGSLARRHRHLVLREAQDLGAVASIGRGQPWSNGKIGLNGISYYARPVQTAALQPKHLSAICIWEGRRRFHRDMAHQGGIFCRGFVAGLVEKRRSIPFRTERGTAASEPHERRLGVRAGDLAGRAVRARIDATSTRTASPQARHRPYWQSRDADWGKVKTPLLSFANWGGQGCTPGGNFEGFVRSASKQEMARVPRHRALDAFLHELRPRPAEEVFRALSSRARTPVGANSRKSAAGAPPRRAIVERHEKSGRSRRTGGPGSTCIRRHDDVGRGAEAESSVTYAGLGRGHLPDRAARAEVELTGGRSRRSFGCPRRRKMSICSWWCGRSRPTSRRSRSRARSIRIRRSSWAAGGGGSHRQARPGSSIALESRPTTATTIGVCESSAP